MQKQDNIFHNAEIGTFVVCFIIKKHLFQIVTFYVIQKSGLFQTVQKETGVTFGYLRIIFKKCGFMCFGILNSTTHHMVKK